MKKVPVKNALNSKNNEKSVEQMTTMSIDTMKIASDTIEQLAKIRAQNKLSNSRVTTVARELRELIKVMTMYSC